MKSHEREATVRRMLERTPPPVPPDLCAEVVRHGDRMVRHHMVVRRLIWLALLAATIAFVIWAWTVHPWVEPPSTTTPPFGTW